MFFLIPEMMEFYGKKKMLILLMINKYTCNKRVKNTIHGISMIILHQIKHSIGKLQLISNQLERQKNLYDQILLYKIIKHKINTIEQTIK